MNQALRRGKIIHMFSCSGPSIWKWSDGNHVNFTNWVPGFPVQIRNDCAQLEWSRFNSSKWFNSPCSSKRHFICQAPKGNKESCHFDKNVY